MPGTSGQAQFASPLVSASPQNILGPDNAYVMDQSMGF